MVEDIKKMPVGAGLPEMPEEIKLAPKKVAIDYKRIIFILLGLGIFILFYLIPGLPDAVDPGGKVFKLPWAGKMAIGLFLMAGIWWVFEVMPIGVTAIAIGLFQVLFYIRPAKEALRDFLDPSVWFIFGSVVIGTAFSASGLTKRMAYKMLTSVGERTNLILLGVFLVTAAMTLIMAHTAVAAALFPLLMAINALYSESDQPTKFGKGLFIGMAWAAGAGSIITFLGAARGVAAAGMFKQFTGNDIGFFELIYYMLPIGLLMVFSIWLIIITFFKPERAVIAGLREKARNLTKELGPMNNKEKFVIFMVLGIVGLFMAKAFVPMKAFTDLDRAGIMLVGTVLFFMTRTLTVEDLETIPWNIILLFGGAMSIGFCLWQTKAAEWLAVHWLSFFLTAPWLVFVLGIAFFVLIMTNFIMNVAAIAIALPVSLVIAKYLGVAPHVILFASLVTAGMPFNLLIGAAPNAIAYESKQFTTGEFFGYGWIPSVVLMAVLAVFVYVIWPLMGMPVLLPK
ncbi:MAG: transporter [Deltaproteobacteria bacterium CG07_land_8_20_14_0_80_60_11]|nr:MAG: transporter [Deltaproteobacteria bacterium CG07_land_8_20_14_0_80_60_11]